MERSIEKDLEALMAEVDQKPVPIDEEALGQAAKLANLQLRLVSEKERLTEELSQVSQKLREISEQLLPEAMSELGLAELKLVDGSMVSIQAFYNAKIKEGLQEKAYEWLRTHDHADVIKTEVIVPFGKGDIKAAEALKKSLLTTHDKTKATYSVHAQTLKKLTRELHEEGKNLPSDFFDIYIGRVAKLKRS